MNEEKVKVIYKEIGKDPIEKEIENTLEAKQELVEGLIEVVPYKEDLLLICNEEDKLLNLEPNIDIGYDYIVGNCFVIGDDWENEGFKSVPKDKITEIKQDLKERAKLLDKFYNRNNEDKNLNKESKERRNER